MTEDLPVSESIFEAKLNFLAPCNPDGIPTDQQRLAGIRRPSPEHSWKLAFATNATNGKGNYYDAIPDDIETALDALNYVLTTPQFLGNRKYFVDRGFHIVQWQIESMHRVKMRMSYTYQQYRNRFQNK